MADTNIQIQSIKHPDYIAEVNKWIKFRATYTAGKAFVEEYLVMFSTKEDLIDFANRKKISYCPAHAKSAINDIKNAIFQRLIETKREGGSASYRSAISGKDGGVDFAGNSMNGFIGREVLPDLLSIRKIGIFLDKSTISKSATKRDTVNIRPYLYTYAAEDILSWSFDEENVLTAVLLRDNVEVVDETFGLTVGTKIEYRYLTLENNKVIVKFYNSDGKELDKSTTINIPRIPFVIGEISQSLLEDVADYQITLVNLASSDTNYCFKANYPFYVEQVNMLQRFAHLRQANATDGTAEEAEVAEEQQTKAGVSQGRLYGKDLNQPAFIHPSAEPLLASMQKQDRMEMEIRQLVNLAVSNVTPRNSSAKNKELDDKPLEAGLSNIGIELEHVERQIAVIWSLYESHTDDTIVIYPSTYTLKTDEERYDEANTLTELMPKVPSLAYQREMAKRIVGLTVGIRTSSDELNKMYKEIDQVKVVVVDPSVIRADHEAGFIGTELASEARLYPEGEWEQAAKDHAERATRILAAQTSMQGARGVVDLGEDDDGIKEKEASRNTDLNDDTKDQTRGEGK